MNPTDTTREAALTEDVWNTVQSRLLGKMLEEFSFEEIIEPESVDTGDEYSTFAFDLDGTSYRFDAIERMMDSMHVEADTVQRQDGETWSEVGDPLTLLRDLGEATELDGLTEGNLVREYKQTLLADAHIEARKRNREEFDPLDLDYAALEGEMEGHPWITYNKGRIGWGYDDYKQYAPERSEPVTLSWVGVRKTRSTFVSTDEHDHDSLVQSELGDHYDVFRDRLSERGLDPNNYYLLPVHDWQWEHSIVPLFPGDIATDDIVPLGEGPDEYLPQQSVRTFVNIDHDDKHHVKVPMRILNTLVWRGLPGERTELAPAATEYVKGIYERDEFLQEQGLVLPGEIAGLNYDHADFTDIDNSPYQYHELLGAVWRESIYTFLEGDEQAITLSSLMHVDGEGEPYISRLIEQSGLTTDEWLDEFFGTILPPLLHVLYKYGTVFSPHGQNTILIVEDGVPSRLAVKDFIDDVNVSAHPIPELDALPENLEGVLRQKPPAALVQFIFSGLFVCVLRYVVDVLAEYEDYDEEQFWTHAADAILDYQAQFPELAERFEIFDIFAPEFTKVTLNRNRIFDYGYDDAKGRPYASLHGTLPNVLHDVTDDGDRQVNTGQPRPADD
jgi:siderophore synthetase component